MREELKEECHLDLNFLQMVRFSIELYTCISDVYDTNCFHFIEVRELGDVLPSKPHLIHTFSYFILPFLFQSRDM